MVSSRQVPHEPLDLWTLVKLAIMTGPTKHSEYLEPLLPSCISLIVTLQCACPTASSGTTLAMPSTARCLQDLHGVTQREAVPLSWQSHAGMWDVPPPSIIPAFCLLEEVIFYLKPPTKAICSTGLADRSSARLRPPHRKTWCTDVGFMQMRHCQRPCRKKAEATCRPFSCKSCLFLRQSMSCVGRDCC